MIRSLGRTIAAVGARLMRRGQLLRLRLALRGKDTPPGNVDPIDRGVVTEQRYLLDRHRALGPVFKGAHHGAWATFVVGHRHIRRLLAEIGDALPCETIDLKPLFPIGAIRGMQGATHATYRQHLVHAIQAVPMADLEAPMLATIRDCVASLGAAAADTITIEKAAPVLRATASTILLRVLFGIEAGTPRHDALREAYGRFSPGELKAHIGPAQREAYRDIRTQLDGERSERGHRSACPANVDMLDHMIREDVLDETLLGNLIYIHETGHFDIFSLWRWILHHLGTSPQAAERLRALSGDEARRWAEAIVSESLRLEQSEVLSRRAARDMVFDGYRIPRGTHVHLCLWEGHKDPGNFPDPFRFDPARFMREPPGPDAYAPFGLDRHRCIGAELVMRASTIFVEELVRRYHLSIDESLPPYRGRYHWQPDPQTRLRLTPVHEADAGACVSALDGTGRQGP